MKIDELRKYKKILIVGYGKEGRAAEAYLKRFIPDVEIGIADKKDGIDYLEKQKEFDLAIKSPGVPSSFLSIPFTTGTNIFLENIANVVIGITGTKGKSTTATLLHQSLLADGRKSIIIGNIGTPSIETLLEPVDRDAIIIIELSSYQLADISVSAHISVFLNIYPEHLDYHGSFEDYFSAKANLIKFAKKDDYFVYNPVFPTIKQLASQTVAKTIPFTDTVPFSLIDSQLLGEHNADNVRAVLSVAKIINLEPSIVEKACRAFKSLPHRMEKIGKFNEILFIDDGAATTPQSTIFAIQTIPHIDTIFLGGLDRGYDFSGLVETINEYRIRNVVLFPDSGTSIFNEMQKKNITPQNVLQTNSMSKAIEFAFEKTEKNGVCLLSSASPSYSLWKNWDEKGAEFKKYIEEYAAKTN